MCVCGFVCVCVCVCAGVFWLCAFLSVFFCVCCVFLSFFTVLPALFVVCFHSCSLCGLLYSVTGLFVSCRSVLLHMSCSTLSVCVLRILFLWIRSLLTYRRLRSSAASDVYMSQVFQGCVAMVSYVVQCFGGDYLPNAPFVTLFMLLLRCGGA